MSATTAQGTSDYQQGIMHAMRAHQENLSEPGHKRFTDNQKAALQGYCKVKSWAEVPAIWKQVEGCKNDVDLRRVLARHWATYQKGGLGGMFYNVYWSDDLITAIRTLNLCTCTTPSYATAMDGLSMLHLLPWSQEDIRSHEREQKIRHKTAGTRTYAEERKLSKAARLPPTNYERILLLLTTYVQLLEMLFTEHNSHQEGVVTVRNQLLSMAQTSGLITATLLVNIQWAVMVDACKHFGECMDPDAFPPSPGSRLR